MAVTKPAGCSTETIERNSYVENPNDPLASAQSVVIEGGDINVTADIESATSPKIYNVSVPTINTEVSQVLTTGTKRFTIRVRNGTARLQLAFTSTESATKFISLPKGASYSEDGLNLTSVTIYFQCDKASQTVEIMEWS